MAQLITMKARKSKEVRTNTAETMGWLDYAEFNFSKRLEDGSQEHPTNFNQLSIFDAEVLEAAKAIPVGAMIQFTFWIRGERFDKAANKTYPTQLVCTKIEEYTKEVTADDAAVEVK